MFALWPIALVHEARRTLDYSLEAVPEKQCDAVLWRANARALAMLSGRTPIPEPGEETPLDVISFGAEVRSAGDTCELEVRPDWEPELDQLMRIPATIPMMRFFGRYLYHGARVTIRIYGDSFAGEFD